VKGLTGGGRTSTRSRSRSTALRRSRAKHTERSSSKVIRFVSRVEYALTDRAVIGVRGLDLPFPEQPTAVSCTLNNGIHYVATPETRLARDYDIKQEFEL
jgi:hypothetical protein